MKMSISSDFECHHEASSLQCDAHDVAIILNNTGVTMLQKACYVLASECFRDALHVMRLVNNASGNNSNNHVDINIELCKKMEN